MVARAAAKGRTTSAKTVQASHVFSHAHLRAYFIGVVKLALAMPAIMRVKIPLDVLLIIGFPLSYVIVTLSIIFDHAARVYVRRRGTLRNMPAKSDNLIARHEYILQRLQETGSVAVDELCTTLGASIATIRRDLEDLETRSLLRRTRGGAVRIGPLFYEPFRNDSSFQDKVSSFAEEKRRIALAAAKLVSTGQTIALTGGTTTTEVVRSLKGLSGISIITNTVNVAMELSNRKDIEVIVTGGHLRGTWFTLVGPLATA